MVDVIDWKSVKHFNLGEFQDSEGKCWISQELVHKLDTARELAGVPFVISSACRNHKQNTAAGGKINSAHLGGLAVDIDCNSSYKRYRMYKALFEVGFSRIGTREDFIHVDIDMSKDQEVAWVY